MKKVIGALLMFAFSGALILSLFQVTSAQTKGHNARTTHECPFMSHEDTLCPISLSAHLDAWKIAFQSTVFSYALLLLAIASVTLLPSHFWFRTREKIPILLVTLRLRTYTFFYRPLQELFSKGILHPKLF